LGLEYLVAESINMGHKVDYIDAWVSGMTLGQIGERVLKNNPDVVGISPSMDSFPIVIELVRFLRKRRYEGKIVLGGIYASFEADSLLTSIGSQIDGILAGEVDDTFQKIFTNLLNLDFFLSALFLCITPFLTALSIRE